MAPITPAHELQHVSVTHCTHEQNTNTVRQVLEPSQAMALPCLLLRKPVNPFVLGHCWDR